jgi:succinate-acetate transporter protein
MGDKDARVNLSLDELSRLLRSVQAPKVPKSGLGNPGPLGLGGFALTTMTLSIYNAGILTDTSGLVLAVALFYGGIAQFIAGLYEYRISNTFGATAFCSYGAFWCSYAGYVYFIVPSLPADKVHEASGLFLLMWLIFTLYMTIASFRVSLVLAVLFSVLSVTFVLLCIGDFAEAPNVTKAGGAFGIMTAIIAWYGSAAVVINSTWGRTLLPVGVFVQPKRKVSPQDQDNMIPLIDLRRLSDSSDQLSGDDDIEHGMKKDKEVEEPKKKGVLNAIKQKTFGSSH